MQLSLSLKDQTHSALKTVGVVFASSILISLFANLSIPLPFTPVPIVLTVNLCLLLGALLGSKKASSAVALYLFYGAMGFPVFAGGKAGAMHLIGPTAGYLFGYLIATYLVGYITEHLKEKTPGKILATMSLGAALIFFLGAIWLKRFLPATSSAFLLGVAPFIIGDLFKLIAATKLYGYLARSSSN
jgi:biotin transport system substrate-specific component